MYVIFLHTHTQGRVSFDGLLNICRTGDNFVISIIKSSAHIQASREETGLTGLETLGTLKYVETLKSMEILETLERLKIYQEVLPSGRK